MRRGQAEVWSGPAGGAKQTCAEGRLKCRVALQVEPNRHAQGERQKCGAGSQTFPEGRWECIEWAEGWTTGSPQRIPTADLMKPFECKLCRKVDAGMDGMDGVCRIDGQGQGDVWDEWDVWDG
eukprot:356652-Chlamydomonas_euryale.AAC.2